MVDITSTGRSVRKRMVMYSGLGLTSSGILRGICCRKKKKTNLRYADLNELGLLWISHFHFERKTSCTFTCLSEGRSNCEFLCFEFYFGKITKPWNNICFVKIIKFDRIQLDLFFRRMSEFNVTGSRMHLFKFCQNSSTTCSTTWFCH